jgi:hypothetical protein
MRLISRHRSHQRAKAPRIAISQAEITADLHYPASRRARAAVDSAQRSAAAR